MTPRKCCIAAMTLVIGVASATAQIPTRQLDDYFKDKIAAREAPSISVAIVKNGSVVYAKAFGLSDLENDVQATPQTVYRIGSITKQFTATIIMQLVQEGKLTLDQPVSSILTDLPSAWSSVTVRHLLTHTGGVKSYTELPLLFLDAALKPTTPAGIIRTVDKFPLDFPPGSEWHYSNTGYELLGMIIEKADGRPFAKSLQARILDPVGMKSTYFVSERAIVKHRAQGYEPDRAAFVHARYLNMDWPYAAGSIETTTLDLAKWDAALYGDKVLPQSRLHEMWTPAVLTSGKKTDYGFGWQIHDQNGVPVYEHGGGIHGFITDIRRAPSRGITVIVLTNSGGSNPGVLAVTAMGMVDSKLKPVPPKVVVDHDPAFTEFARSIVESIIDGKLDRTTFSPEFNRIIIPEIENTAHEQLKSLGKLNSIVLLDDLAKDGTKSRKYRLSFGSTQLIMSIAVNRQKLVTGLDFRAG